MITLKSFKKLDTYVALPPRKGLKALKHMPRVRVFFSPRNPKSPRNSKRRVAEFSQFGEKLHSNSISYF